MIRVRHLLAAGLASLAPALTAGAQEFAWTSGEPLRVRNLSPATQLFGLPRTLGAPADPGRLEVSLLVEHVNNFSADMDGTAAVVFDGATTVTSLALRRGVGDRFEWGLEVPYVRHDGGFTDGLIEGFHELFGFPNADRDAVPRDRLDYRIVYGDRELVNISDDKGRVGDVRAWFGYRLYDGRGRQAVLRAMVEAPTGEFDDLSGSESTDVALWLELADSQMLEALNLTVTLAGGVTVPGDSDLPGQRDAVPSGHLGLHYPLTSRVTLRAQLDGHGQVIRTGLEPLGASALLGTLGASVQVSPSLRLDLGLVEDLTPHSAPDVVFMTSLSARF